MGPCRQRGRQHRFALACLEPGWVRATLVPEPEATTGAQFDPLDIEEMCQKLTWLTLLTEDERRSMGERAAEMVSSWGPDRFAQGTLEALDLATRSQRTSRSLVLERVR